MKYWLVNKDPTYIGLFNNPYITGSRISPTKTLNNQGSPFFSFAHETPW